MARTVFLVSQTGWDTETPLIVTATRVAAEAYVLASPDPDLYVAEMPFAGASLEAIAIADNRQR